MNEYSFFFLQIFAKAYACSCAADSSCILEKADSNSNSTCTHVKPNAKLLTKVTVSCQQRKCMLWRS